jgi:hypothetical protein
MMGVLFGLVGSLLLATGVGWLARNVLRLWAYSTRVEGTVTGFTEPDADGNTFPLLGFVWEGRRIEVKGVAAPWYWQCRTVALRFPPGRPNQAIIADFANQYLFPVAVIAAAAVLILMALTLHAPTGNSEAQGQGAGISFDGRGGPPYALQPRRFHTRPGG